MASAIDRRMGDIESRLTEISVYPVIGTLAGATKVLIGISQAVAASAYSILALTPAVISGDWSHVEYAGGYVKHGLRKIVVGTLESIPIVQTSFYFARKGMEVARIDVQDLIQQDLSAIRDQDPIQHDPSAIRFEIHYQGRPALDYFSKVFRVVLIAKEEPPPQGKSTDYTIYGLVNPALNDQQITTFEWSHVEHDIDQGIDRSCLRSGSSHARGYCLPPDALMRLVILVHVTTEKAHFDFFQSNEYDQVAVEVTPFSNFQIGHNYRLKITHTTGEPLKGQWEMVSPS